MSNQAALKSVKPQVIAQHRGEIILDVIAKGDLAKLSDEGRARYYVSVCESIGLNPQTQPLAYIELNKKLTLYALKGATDQLRKIYNVSIVRIDKELLDELFVVTVSVRDESGRVDEDMGAVPIKGLSGEAKVNAMLKAITKAKRRATLSICGLGLLDETEVETVPGARVVPVDTATGEILDDPTQTPIAPGAPEVIKAEHSAEYRQAEAAIDAKAAVNQPAIRSPMKQSTVTDMKALHAEAGSRGLNHEDVHALAKAIKGVDSITELDTDQMTAFRVWVQSVTPSELDKWLMKAGQPTMDERIATAK